MTSELRSSGDSTLSARSGDPNAILISSDLLTLWLIPTATIFDVQFCKKKENYKVKSVTSNSSPVLTNALQEIFIPEFCGSFRKQKKKRNSGMAFTIFCLLLVRYTILIFLLAILKCRRRAGFIHG